jgi:hypothetical protein
MTLDLYERNALFCALLVTENENEFAYIYYLLTSRKVSGRVKNGKISRHIQRIFKDVNSEYYNNYQRNYQKKRRKK